MRILALSFVLFASPVMAQVFPGISARDAEAVVRKAPAAGEAKPGPAEPEPPVVVDQPAPPKPTEASGPTKEQKELEKKFKEALSGLRAEQIAVDRHTRDLVKNCHDDFKDYVTALVDFHTENYTRCSTMMFRFTPPGGLRQPSNASKERYWNLMKQGSAMLEGTFAACYNQFDLNARNERGIKSKAKAAGDQAIAGARAMRGKANQAPYEAEAVAVNSLTLDSFAKNIEAEWVAVWNAAEKARAAPWEFEPVWELAVLLHQPYKLEMNLTQRLLLRYLLANFKDHPRVRNGEVHEKLAWTLVRTWQFEDARKVIDEAFTAQIGNATRARELDTARGAMSQERRQIEMGLLRVGR